MPLNNLTRNLALLPLMLILAVAIMAAGANPIRCKAHSFPL
jgi:hypothetical protein